MSSERPDHGVTQGSIIDDKIAEARERIGRIAQSAGATSADAQNAARAVEERTPEPPAGGEKAFERSLAELETASHDLKERIIEEKRRNNMPIDSALGNPEIERQNADGRNDLPAVDDE